MITKQNIPIWNSTIGAHEFTSCNIYNKIIDNFEKNCILNFADKKILFLDNTYIDGEKVLLEISKNDYEVVFIFSLVDPPYTWCYLKELCNNKFPNIKFIFVGNDGLDFDIPFGMLWSLVEFPKYTIDDILPTNFKYVYLSYNGKSHRHRINFVQQLVGNQLDKLGFYTLSSTEFTSNQHGFNLGNLKIWNNHFLNIVSEVVFRIQPELALTEKIWKPIVGMRPFIINGSPRYYTILKDMGFDCFEDIFPISDLAKNESTIELTMQKSHAIICSVIKDLNSQNLQEMYNNLYPRLLKNRKHFFDYGNKMFETFCVNDIKF